MPSYSGGDSGRSLSGGITSHSVDDPRVASIRGVEQGTTVKSQSLGYSGGRPELPLPPDASSTLFVEGLPANCTRREVSRILSFPQFPVYPDFPFSSSILLHLIRLYLGSNA